MGERRQSDFVTALLTSFALVSSLFIIAGVQVLFHLQLQRFGIIPRTQAGLPGILFAPLLHGSWQPLLSNAPPLYVLLVLLLSNPAYQPYRTLSFIWLASGAGTWLIGRPAVHIGASSVIFGLAAFLIMAGFLMRSWRAAFIAIFVATFAACSQESGAFEAWHASRGYRAAFRSKRSGILHSACFISFLRRQL